MKALKTLIAVVLYIDSFLSPFLQVSIIDRRECSAQVALYSYNNIVANISLANIYNDLKSYDMKAAQTFR